MIRIHITHTDLDAAGCHVVFKQAFGSADVFYPVNHDRIDATVKKALFRDIGIKATTLLDVTSGQARENIDEVLERHDDIVLWITDIAPSEGILDSLRTLCEETELFTELFVCDHHPTTDCLQGNKYGSFASWKKGQCGAWLAYEHAIADGILSLDTDTKALVDAVDAYDLWKLDSPYRKRGEDLNTLFKLYGIEHFAQTFADNLKHDTKHSSQDLIRVLSAKARRTIDARVQSIGKDESNICTDSNDYTYLIVLDGDADLTSQLGHAVLEKFPRIDYVVLLQPNGVVSMRSRKNGVDVGAIAKQHGGGGHPGAAGFKIDLQTFYKFLLGELL